MRDYCPPGQHRTLVMIDTGKEPVDRNSYPYICLNCGKAFCAVEVDVGDRDIEEVLKIAAENTRNNIKTLRTAK